jgi:hypothetical protein
MLTKDDYINENIKLSLKNTTIILQSIEKNLNSIKNLSHKIQQSTDKQESITYLTKIKEISLESVSEKCNMLKSALDRYVISYEDVQIPKEIKYLKLRGLTDTPIDQSKIPRFKDKLSKNNIPPPVLSPVLIEDDGECFD